MAVSPLAWIAADLVLVLGASIQGTIGFGTNLVAAPILALINPDLVPVPIILVSFIVNVLVGVRDRGDRPWHAMRWPIVGQIPACVVGAAAVAVIDRNSLSILFGVLVLVGVGLSVIGRHPRPTPAVGVAAGAASGFMGTTTGIGGPPMALVYQREQGPQFRASLTRFFGLGSIAAIVPLLLFGQVHVADVGRALLLAPGVLIGFALSGRFSRYVDHGWLRPAVLTVSGLSAVVLLVRALV
jgi:uncharacterized membrane protein YfcA